jgi:hypothetical protein
MSFSTASSGYASRADISFARPRHYELTRTTPAVTAWNSTHFTLVPKKNKVVVSAICVGTAGTAIYKDFLYGNLYVIPICYVESGI